MVQLIGSAQARNLEMISLNLIPVTKCIGA